MSKGPQKRCPWTGERKAVIDYLDDNFLTSDGSFNPDVYRDCDVFDIRSFAAAAGFRDWGYFRDQILTNAGSHWHVHRHSFTVYRPDEGTERAEIYATHSNSAAAGGENYRAFQKEQRRARIPTYTDVTSN